MLKDPSAKYRQFAPINLTDRTWPDRVITQPPIWCSVDLRDGNQALIEPMNSERKRRMFDMLVEIGFKEIEIGFPSASQMDFDFVRHLIEDNLIPDDVTIQVLTPAREHLIERTFESLKGVKKAIVHMYNATSPVMREVVFGMSREDVRDMVITHCQLLSKLSKAQPETEWFFEYSPEHFSGTELDFSREIIDVVVETLGGTKEHKVIINLPSTVEYATANVFADQIEWIHRNVSKREAIVLSVHPHNDRGTGVAAGELALMAGADRVEGCLFGNGERTGNLDIVNIALNMYTQGIHPKLNFAAIDEIRQAVEYCNQLPVHCRHPYVGDLVYTSFSGSHQDAIKKAFAARKENDVWEMPYLPIDPMDLGRSYEAIIRVNAQSGKGGIAYLLHSEYGLDLPRRLQIEFSQVVQQQMDATGKELNASAIWDIFSEEYLTTTSPYMYVSHRLSEDSTKAEEVKVQIEILLNGEKYKANGQGNGPIDAFVQAIGNDIHAPVKLLDYSEHSIGTGANAKAVSYIEMSVGDGQKLHGVGIDANIVTASFKALLSGLNRDAKARG